MDVAPEVLTDWLEPGNLAKRSTRILEGFSIAESIDGATDPSREVLLVTIMTTGQYPQHVHRSSDAFFIIVEGRAMLLSGRERRELRKGDSIAIPRGMPHGFDVAEGETLQFVSIQSPPIRNPKTGEEDFLLIERV